MSYHFHPAAEAEFLESVGYYDSKVPGLGGALIEEFEALANLIGESPKGWQIALSPDIRIATLHRFPLSIIYREKPDGFQARVGWALPCPANPTIKAGQDCLMPIS